MADVFLSYSRQDQAFVRQLFGALEVAGQDTWVDWEDIPLTTDWWAEIRGGIEEAKAFIFVMTPASLSSQVCTLEVALALTMHKRIIPVLPAPFDPDAAIEHLKARPVDNLLKAIVADRELSQIAAQNWQTLSSINWVPFADREFDTVARQLLDVLQTDYEHAKTHTRLLQRALEWDRASRPNSLLMRGDAQREAEGWVRYNADKIPKPTDIHREYVASGIRQRVWEYRRLRLLVAVLAVLLVLALGAGILAVNRSELAQRESLARATQQTIAEQNAAQAEANLRAQWGLQSLFLAGQSRQILTENGDTTLSINLALEAFAHFDDGIFRREAQFVLSETLNHPLQLIAPMSGITNIIDVDASVDGGRYLVATPQAVYLWERGDDIPMKRLTANRAIFPTTSHILGVSFINGDRQMVVVASDRTVVLTFDHSAEPLIVLADQAYERVVLSESGGWIWAAQHLDDNRYAMAAWAVDGSAYRTLADVSLLRDAYFSPNQRYLALPLTGNKTLLWDLQADSTVTVAGSSIIPVTWAGDDLALVRDIQGTLRALRMGGTQPEQLFFIGQVVNAVPSPDGSRIAIITSDEMLHVLRASDGQQEAEMFLLEDSASAIVWNAAQTHLMTWGRESIWIWALADEFPESMSFIGGSFGLFTETHALVASDRAISLIALTSNEAEIVTYPIYPILEMGWNAASQRLMVRAGTSSLRLLSAGQPPQPRILTPDEVGTAVELLPCHPQILGDIYQTDGPKLTTCNADISLAAGVMSEYNQIRVWALDDPQIPRALFYAPYAVRSMRFSPDNTRLAVVDDNTGRAHIYSFGEFYPVELDTVVDGDTLRWREDSKAIRLKRLYADTFEEWLIDPKALIALARETVFRGLTESERAKFYLTDQTILDETD